MMPAKEENGNLGNNRRPTQLAPHVDKGLLGYAAAASAAGVSLLAMVQPAEAKIIFTPANLPITVNGPLVGIDFNHDGIVDFNFYNVVQSGADQARAQGRPPLGFYAHALSVIPAQASNSVGAITSFTKTPCAAELGPGRKVGPGKNFLPNQLALFAVAGDYTSPGTLNCPWQRGQGGFLGLKFVVGGQTFYGWVRINLGTVPTIIGYAYENIPNGTILTGATKGADEHAAVSDPPVLPAPQPASLGLLANGASGIAAWRRPEEMN
jgi:hypothetical protein